MGLSFKEIKELLRSRRARDTQGLFVTEGKKLFLEAPRESLVCVAVTKDFAAENPGLLNRVPSGVEVIADIRPERFAGLSDTKTPQGILAVQKKPSFSMERCLGVSGRGADKSAISSCAESRMPSGWASSGRGADKSAISPYSESGMPSGGASSGPGERESGAAPLFLLLEDIQDPGNAGTILRTAEAAGVTAVFSTKGTVDFFHPKTIRSTMGSIFRVPVFVLEELPPFFETLGRAGIRSFAAHLRGSLAYDRADYRGGSIFLIGNEGNGLTEETARAADTLIRIPMAGKVESLNAAMAAGILLFEAARQRRG